MSKVEAKKVSFKDVDFFEDLSDEEMASDEDAGVEEGFSDDDDEDEDFDRFGEEADDFWDVKDLEGEKMDEDEEDEEEEDEEEDEEDEEEDEEDEEDLMSRFMAGELHLPGGDEKYDDFFRPPQKNAGHPDKMAKEIEELEKMMLEKKHWRLRGEVEADERPENALLDVVVDYDDVGTEKPMMSEDIEDEIQRLVMEDAKNKTFDDVKRRTAPVKESLRRQATAAVVNSEKPKPLSQVYDDEFRKLHLKQEDPLKEEVRKDLLELLGKLSALSNLHFVPAPLPDVKLTKPVAAVTVEEAIPAAVSSAQLQTPAEAVGQRRQPIGDSELTGTDKRRFLKRKKKRQGAVLRDRREREGDSSGDAMRRVLKMAHRPQSNVVVSKGVATMWGQKLRRAMRPHGGRKGRRTMNRSKVLE